MQIETLDQVLTGAGSSVLAYTGVFLTSHVRQSCQAVQVLEKCIQETQQRQRRQQ